MNTYVQASHKPQTGWVSPELIDDRLEVEYYNPDYVTLDIQLENSGLPIDTLGNISRTFTGPFGSNLPSSLYRQSGIPLLRVQNIGDFGINLDNLVYLDQPTHSHLGDSRLISGDLALAKSGSFGKIAPIWPAYGECNITEHILGIRVTDPKIDPIFLAAFLVSVYGLSQIKRKALGTILKYLGVQVSRSIKIPRVDPKIQAYIGDKVRLAEKCREEAAKLFSEAQTMFAELVRVSEFSPRSNNSNNIQSKQMTDRLSAEFHLPKYYDLENHLALLEWPVLCISDLLREPIIRLSSPASSNTTGYPCILTSDIEPYFIEWETPSLWISPEDYPKWKGILQPDDVVYTSVGPPVGEAAVVLASHLPMVIGGDVSIIRTNQDLHPGYLALFLNSIFGQMQNERYARGIRQRRVYPDDITSFLISVLPKDTQNAIGQRVVRSEILNKISRELMKRAIKDMERLIDGTLDTIQIISGTIRPEGWDFVEQELERQENA